MLALYLISSALSRFDRRQLSLAEVGLRLGLAVLLMMRHEFIYASAAIAAIGLIAFHTRRRPAAA